MGKRENIVRDPRITVALFVALIATALAVALPGGASARGSLSYYHGTASNGQYIDLTTSPDWATVTFTRLWEKCKPLGIRLLVNPAALVTRAPINKYGKFSKTVKGAGEKTTYTGTVRANSATVRVQDTGSSTQTCSGADVTFQLNLVR